jgi:hypothetical protein
MTLDQWIELSPEDRNALRRRWDHDGGDWIDLLSDARARFEAEFGSHPLINQISQCAWHAASTSHPLL